MSAPKTEPAEPDLLNHPLIPEDEFKRKMRNILAVPKKELEEALEVPEQENADKPKRGPKKE